jgi:hypothetical protein
MTTGDEPQLSQPSEITGDEPRLGGEKRQVAPFDWSLHNLHRIRLRIHGSLADCQALKAHIGAGGEFVCHFDSRIIRVLPMPNGLGVMKRHELSWELDISFAGSFSHVLVYETDPTLFVCDTPRFSEWDLDINWGIGRPLEYPPY